VILQIRDHEKIILWACILGGIMPVSVGIEDAEEHCKKIEKIRNSLVFRFASKLGLLLFLIRAYTMLL